MSDAKDTREECPTCEVNDFVGDWSDALNEVETNE